MSCLTNVRGNRTTARVLKLLNPEPLNLERGGYHFTKPINSDRLLGLNTCCTKWFCRYGNFTKLNNAN